MTASLPDTLAQMAQMGDRWAVEELLRFHQRMIAAISNRFVAVAQSMTKADLQQECVMGLLELLPSWKVGAGNSFATHCFTYLPHRVRRRLDSVDGIVKITARAGPAMRKRYQQTGEATQPMAVSMYKPNRFDDGHGEDILLDEVEGVGSQVDYVKRDQIRICGELIQELRPNYREVFVRVALDEESVTDVAASLGVSKQCVSATYHRALKKLQALAVERGVV